MLVLIGAFMGGFVLFNGKDDLLRVTWLLFFAFISTSVETLAKWIVTTGGIISRYNFDPPTGMGQGDTARSLILGFIITILLIAYHKGAKRFILILSILLIFLSIIIIQSRASYIIFIIQFLLIVLLIVKFSQTKFSSLFSILLISALIVFFFIDTQIESFSSIFNNISDNIFNIKSTELSNKLLIFQDGKKMFISNPFFGVGWGNFGLHTTALIEISSTWYNVSTPHNGIIQLLSETGLIGTIPALWISILVLIFIYLQYKQQRDARLKLFFGFLLIIFLTVIASQFIVSSYLFPSPTLRSSVRISFYHWFLIGYAYSFIKCKSTKRLGNVTAL
jgi:O-antigen ligase